MGEIKEKVIWEQDIRDLILSLKLAIILSFSLVIINIVQMIMRLLI